MRQKMSRGGGVMVPTVTNPKNYFSPLILANKFWQYLAYQRFFSRLRKSHLSHFWGRAPLRLWTGGSVLSTHNAKAISMLFLERVSLAQCQQMWHIQILCVKKASKTRSLLHHHSSHGFCYIRISFHCFTEQENENYSHFSKLAMAKKAKLPLNLNDCGEWDPYVPSPPLWQRPGSIYSAPVLSVVWNHGVTLDRSVSCMKSMVETQWCSWTMRLLQFGGQKGADVTDDVIRVVLAVEWVPLNRQWMWCDVVMDVSRCYAFYSLLCVSQSISLVQITICEKSLGRPRFEQPTAEVLPAIQKSLCTYKHGWR